MQNRGEPSFFFAMMTIAPYGDVLFCSMPDASPSSTYCWMMALSFVLWYTNNQDKAIYLTYEIYFPGTVSGLTRGSPVRYLGVDVGKVTRILIDPQQRNRVLVIADIQASAPIDGSTRASLSLQGVTGLLFIDLEQDHKVAAPGVLADGLHYPVIRSAPSDFDVLLSSLPALPLVRFTA